MSKAKAEDLMSEFFAERRQERAQENELLQDRLEDAKSGLESSWEGREWMKNNFLDNLNFMKQDHNAPPPKTKSGTVTQAMLSRVTSKENAKKLAEQAETAGAMLGQALHGAVAVMTAEAASNEIVETVRAQTPGRQRPDSAWPTSSTRSSTPSRRGRDVHKQQADPDSITARQHSKVGSEEGGRRSTTPSARDLAAFRSEPPPASGARHRAKGEEASSGVRSQQQKPTARPMNDLYLQSSAAIQSSGLSSVAEEVALLSIYESISHLRARMCDKCAPVIMLSVALCTVKGVADLAALACILAVVSFFTPPKPASGSASRAPKSLPSWMNT